MSDPGKPLAPAYRRDLQTVVSRAFANPAPVPVGQVPGGLLSARVAAQPDAAEELVGLAGETPPTGADVRIVEPEVYWPLALAHRVVILGPLLDIASGLLPHSQMLASEQSLLAAYHQTYGALPLPLDLLELLQQYQLSGDDEFLHWLDRASESLMTAPTLDLLRQTRSVLRLESIRQLASWTWSEPAVCAAEFTIDLVTLCRAVAMDVKTAESLSQAHAGSVALAVRALDERQALKFEEILPSLAGSPVETDHLRDEERPWIESLVRTRNPVWDNGLLSPPQAPAIETIEAPDIQAPVAVRNRANPEPVTEESSGQDGLTGSDLFQDLKEKLESRIVGRPQLCRELALAGAAHLLGVQGQRLLLCGPTGSGKSHAAEALAESIDRPHLFVSTGDLTATGFRGADINDLLESLDSRCKKTGPGILIIDEADKARLIPGSTANSRSAQNGLIVSLLNLLDGRAATPDESRGEQVETAPILILGTGSFDNLFTTRPPSSAALIAWGWPPEFAARWGQRICLTPVSRREAFVLLRSTTRAPAERLRALLDALDVEIRLSDHLVWYTVERWMSAGCDYRTAAEWLLAATRSRIIQHLEGGGPPGATLEIAPDDLPPFRERG